MLVLPDRRPIAAIERDLIERYVAVSPAGTTRGG
jgi:hypothetical protein